MDEVYTSNSRIHAGTILIPEKWSTQKKSQLIKYDCHLAMDKRNDQAKSQTPRAIYTADQNYSDRNIHPSPSFTEGVGFQERLPQFNPFPLDLGRPAAEAEHIYRPNQLTNSTHKNNTTKAATAKPPKPAGAKLAAPPMNGWAFAFAVVIGKPELAATPVPAMVPFKYAVDVLVAVIDDVEFRVIVVVPVGATAGRPLTRLTSRRLLDGLAAGTALKRTLGMTAVERDVEEPLSVTVLMTVFWTVE